MRLRLLRHSPLAFGLLLRRPRDPELTRHWVMPAMTDRRIRDDIARFARGLDRTSLVTAAPRLRDFTGRARIVWGTADRCFTLATARRLAAAFANGELVEVPDVSSSYRSTRPPQSPTPSSPSPRRSLPRRNSPRSVRGNRPKRVASRGQNGGGERRHRPAADPARARAPRRVAVERRQDDRRGAHLQWALRPRSYSVRAARRPPGGDQRARRRRALRQRLPAGDRDRGVARARPRRSACGGRPRLW
jgi:hypothetical protein